MTSHPQWFLLRSELRGFYGLSRGSIDNYQKRGILPPPQAECSTGPLWSEAKLRAARLMPDPTLAAVVPIDDALGRDELDRFNVYQCPDRSGFHIGWSSPSIIGLVVPGNVCQWHSVRAIARYDGETAYEACADEAMQRYLDLARRHRSREHYLTTYLLSEQPLAIGRIRVSERAKTAGLQRGRLLRRDGDKVGAPGAWLTLPPRPSSVPLGEFALPPQDAAFPIPRHDDDLNLSAWQ